MWSEDQSERPWTEADWERFMLESEIRSARFRELFETLRHHPDRDELVAREMGWIADHEQFEGSNVELELSLDDALFGDPGEDDIDDVIAKINELGQGGVPPFDESGDSWLDDELGLEDSDDIEAEIEAHDAELDAIPAYAKGYAWALSMHQALEDYIEREREGEEDERLVDGLGDSLTVAAKVAGGHGLGYDEETLCGNIVCCSQSLKAATNALESLESLSEDGILPSPLVQRLTAEGREVCDLIQQRIAELRARVWWQ